MKEVYVRVGSGLYHHLMRGEDLRGKRLRRRRGLRPQQLDVGVKSHTLQPHAERRYRQDAYEEELSRVRIDDAAQSTQLSLNSATNPQNTAISARFALQQNTACNRPPKKQPDVTQTTQIQYIRIRRTPSQSYPTVGCPS